ncbi:MAG TPA: hypothetical protein VLJ38_13900, partial [Polyangiaceae bacterium]|nr:hypothetical protein [Polyangiaceae bacterium]
GTGGAAAHATGGTGIGSGGTGSGARAGASSGATGGTPGAAGASGDTSGPPGPTADGSSPYAVVCNESTPCTEAGVTCLGIRLEEGGARFTCSNQCETSADCSDAPSGTDAAAGCVEFTSAKHCVLVCYDAGVESDCPDGMGCYRYTNAPIGYCLWL